MQSQSLDISQSLDTSTPWLIRFESGHGGGAGLGVDGVGFANDVVSTSPSLLNPGKT